ncbi:hypothetical protein [Ulvibacter litoralis]|uniref:Curlin associated repeat-containing protein n=1 Tax=Ulvibacter litoralis TaxID=227084 RepID=A0A1G7GNH9_9FLAO|nr:hypothetical protein [Ulvibacter litoralis]GHC55610.1 hypothetical protein GCM10008083_19790 [Ulvibacter litoralis]SDE89613.1 hypothetical protein SAMN05421855_103244 [Ulvibacter litoralis]
MKKVMLSASAFLFVAATMVAQNVSEVDQSGANTGNVTQSSWGALVNYSDLDQVGTNLADIEQAGLNSSTVNQTGNNTADIDQVGGDGFFGPGGANNSVANQTGNLNMAVVDQLGDANVSTLDQTNGAADLKGNSAAVDQDGLANNSDIDQTNDANFARITQSGNGNVSVSSQTSDNLAAPVHPTGYLQGNIVGQTGSLNYAGVTQNGDNQRSDIVQDAIAGGPAADPYTNEAYVLQTGEMNQSTILQMDGITMSANNTANVTQENIVAGPGNVSTVSQNGANTVTVNQTNF